MKIMLCRKPAGFGKDGLEIVPEKEHGVLNPEAVEPVLEISNGELKDLIALLDRGFEVSFISSEKGEVQIKLIVHEKL